MPYVPRTAHPRRASGGIPAPEQGLETQFKDFFMPRRTERGVPNAPSANQVGGPTAPNFQEQFTKIADSGSSFLYCPITPRNRTLFLNSWKEDVRFHIYEGEIQVGLSRWPSGCRRPCKQCWVSSILSFPKTSLAHAHRHISRRPDPYEPLLGDAHNDAAYEASWNSPHPAASYSPDPESEVPTSTYTTGRT